MPRYRNGDRVMLLANPEEGWYEERGTVIRYLGDGLYAIEADDRPDIFGSYREWDEADIVPIMKED
jgi:hypothetical protein